MSGPPDHYETALGVDLALWREYVEQVPCEAPMGRDAAYWEASGEWRRKPPTVRQVAALAKIGKKPPQTRGEASDIIEQAKRARAPFWAR